MPRERVEKVLELVGMHQRIAVTTVSRERWVAHGPVAQVLASQDKGEYRVRGPAAILAQAGALIVVHDDQFVVSSSSCPASPSRCGLPRR